MKEFYISKKEFDKECNAYDKAFAISKGKIKSLSNQINICYWVRPDFSECKMYCECVDVIRRFDFSLSTVLKVPLSYLYDEDNTLQESLSVASDKGLDPSELSSKKLALLLAEKRCLDLLDHIYF